MKEYFQRELANFGTEFSKSFAANQTHMYQTTVREMQQVMTTAKTSGHVSTISILSNASVTQLILGNSQVPRVHSYIK